MEKIVKYLDDSTISFSWTEPHPELHNGIIIYYHVCIRKYGPDFSCTRTAQIPRQNEKSYAYGGLSPSSEYVVVIRAATIIGLGPPAFIQKTAGKSDVDFLQGFFQQLTRPTNSQQVWYRLHVTSLSKTLFKVHPSFYKESTSSDTLFLFSK
jgi:hypothetical protein